MDLRWTHRGLSSALVHPSGVCRGEVVRWSPLPSCWSWGAYCHGRDGRFSVYLGHFATRAAAMRAVAGATDAKKGFFPEGSGG
jgi:hypothetical protein